MQKWHVTKLIHSFTICISPSPLPPPPQPTSLSLSSPLPTLICTNALSLYTCTHSYRLVIVSRFHPEPVLMSLVHFVAPSRPVVVYCNILEV